MTKLPFLAVIGTLLVAGCAGKTPASQSATPAAAINPECTPFTGRFPPVLPGASELRGTMQIPRELEGQLVYVALDYSTSEGQRKSVAVGSLEPTGQSMRFRCMIGSPPDAAFWKWVLLAPPAESCGYYAEATGEVETAVEVTCEASRVFAWDAYKKLFITP